MHRTSRIVTCLALFLIACSPPPDEKDSETNNDDSNSATNGESNTATNASTNNGATTNQATNGSSNGATNAQTNGQTNGQTNAATNNATNSATNNTTGGMPCAEDDECTDGVCVDDVCVDCREWRDCGDTCLNACVDNACVPREAVQTTISDPEDEVVVELLWETIGVPDEMGADLDLHYLNSNGEWNAAPWDIYWENSTADWGDEGDATDDPMFGLDNVTPPGPETVKHSGLNPSVTYSVGVYASSAPQDEETCAVARIYVDGALVSEGAEIITDPLVFWHWAELDGAAKTTFTVDQIFGGFP